MWYTTFVQSNRKQDVISDYLMPSDLMKGGCCPMNAMEVLTLLLVVFETLSYIDNHKKKHKRKKKRKNKNKNKNK